MTAHPLPLPLRAMVVDELDRLELGVWSGGTLVVALSLDARRAALLAADRSVTAVRRPSRDPCHDLKEAAS